MNIGDALKGDWTPRRSPATLGSHVPASRLLPPAAQPTVLGIEHACAAVVARPHHCHPSSDGGDDLST
eukprot:scaffold73815_cov28-Tisochrysis_lutea.AAC.1